MLNTNQSLQSRATSTETRTQFSMQPFHVHGQPLQNMEQSQNTISKEWTQDHIHRRKMSTILFWMHLCIRSKIAILTQFLTSNVHFVRKGCRGHLKIAILPQFLTFNIHFVRKGCGGLTKIAILPQFLASNVHFVQKGCVSWRSGGAAPALRER